MPALETRKLSKYYGRRTGIQEINLSVEEGSFFGILGPDNAGKTTLLRLLLGLLFPTGGSAFIFDMDCLSGPFIRRMIGYAPAFFYAPRSARIRDLLAISARCYGEVDYSRIQELCAILGLDSRCSFGELSAEGRKKTGLIAAMLHDPKLLLLDEPTIGLDDVDSSTLFELLHDLNRGGTTIVFTTTQVEEVRRHCTHAAILDGGALLQAGPVGELQALHAFRITVNIDGNVYDLAKELKIRNFSSDTGALTFTYDGELDRLIKTIAGYHVHGLHIGEPTLDAVVLSCQIRGGAPTRD